MQNKGVKQQEYFTYQHSDKNIYYLRICAKNGSRIPSREKKGLYLDTVIDCPFYAS